MKVYIVQCDCFIQKVDVIHSEEEWKEYIRNVKIQGRGGTDFRPVFELIRQEKERKELKNLRALIYFTDGDGIYPGQKPDYETAFVFLKRTDQDETGAAMGEMSDHRNGANCGADVSLSK